MSKAAACAPRSKLCGESGGPQSRIELRKAILTTILNDRAARRHGPKKGSTYDDPEFSQLRENAQRRSQPEIVGLCEEILKARPKTGTGLPKTGTGRPKMGTAAKAKRPAAA